MTTSRSDSNPEQHDAGQHHFDAETGRWQEGASNNGNSSAATRLATPADLDLCAQEPIHIPNLVQSCGVMVVVSDEPAPRVLQVSDNLEQFTELSVDDVLGQTLETLLGEEHADTVVAAIAAEPFMGPAVRLGRVTFEKQLASTPSRLNVMAHRNRANPGVVILEFEPHVESLSMQSSRNDSVEPAEEGDREHILHLVRRSLVRLQTSQSLQEFCDCLAEEIRGLTGYDRVMIYQFDRQFNGQVISESISPQQRGSIEEFLGLRYPASDIPAQARKLYRKQWIRTIVSVDAPSSAIVPASVKPDGKRLDMSYASLRATSPVHIEYLQNMGVTASMTVSLLKLGEGSPGMAADVLHRAADQEDDHNLPPLWGLIACHHYSGPAMIDFDTRAACELIGQIASMQLTTKLRDDEAENTAERRRLLTRLATRLGDIEKGLERVLLPGASDGPPKDTSESETVAVPTSDESEGRRWLDLTDLMACDGACVLQHDSITCRGIAPPEDMIRAIASWAIRVAEQRSTASPVGTMSTALEIVYSENLTRDLPDLAPADADHTPAGVLVVPFESGDAILWFRREQLRHVTWGGDPNKAVTVDETNGQIRLSPRQSFGKWKQLLRGECQPWSEHDLLIASELRDAILRVLVRQNQHLAKANRELVMSNAELDSFAYAASHDLREPLRGITNLSAFILDDYASVLDGSGQEQLHMIQKLSGRMNDLISSLLQFSRVGRLELDMRPVELESLVNDAADVIRGFIKEKHGEVEIVGKLPTVLGDATRLSEVFTNLITNAFKYNQSDKPRVEIGSQADHPNLQTDPVTGQKPLAIFVRDNGIGIEARYHKDVFRIFRRLHGRDDFGGGTGAGLTIVERVIQRHGGTIWIESDPETAPGTTFWFSLLPLGAAEPQLVGI